jgi:hypothetical protein
MAFEAFVGIDPGITGAIAVLSEGDARAFEMPTYQETVGGKKRLRVDREALTVLWDLEVLSYGRDKIFVVIEKLGPIAKMGSSQPKAKTFRSKGGQGTMFDTEMPSVYDQNDSSQGAGFAVPMVNFQLGRSLGQLEMLLVGIASDEVPWRTWAPAYGIKRKDKDLSLEKARSFYPSVDLSKKKHHGKAEALLLARFGAMMKGGF